MSSWNKLPHRFTSTIKLYEIPNLREPKQFESNPVQAKVTLLPEAFSSVRISNKQKTVLW